MLVETRVQPFEGQRPGTSGLRKTTAEFQRPHYAAAYLQSIFDTVSSTRDGLLVLGGDGRFLNSELIQLAISMAVANGVKRLVVGRDGLLSTPAASHLIRSRGAFGGLIFSASHNPGGPEGDVGIKFNGANGGPASEAVGEAIHSRTEQVERYFTWQVPPIDLRSEGELQVGPATLEIVDPVRGYADLMERLFDFDAIRAAREAGLRLHFDAMHAVTGPYALEIFERRLGFQPGSVHRGTPLPDFGGAHPDPNPVHAQALIADMTRPDAPDLGAASDGDGDRNMVVGRSGPVSPSDALAVLAANLHLAPGYPHGVSGAARSMPTSSALDRVLTAIDRPLFITPTGWKYFGSLLDAGRINFCGEESAGVGSDHVREKDGVWAVLLWLTIMARRNATVDELVREHWRTYGRTYYARHDYENVDADIAASIMRELRTRAPSLAGSRAAQLQIATVEDFSYRDPVVGSLTTQQGIQVSFTDGQRGVMRMSGTGTQGSTLRIYLERHTAELDQTSSTEALAPLTEALEALTQVRRRTGRAGPDVVT